ncbi:flagellar export protein FliJ [Buchnera aphidicola]|uniref:Flagellar FliJ protein n=1 Tax=Buchnera aphidicola (Aphis aurantii) TaxID=1470492 RepID=A0AAU6W771_9GAMM
MQKQKHVEQLKLLLNFQSEYIDQLSIKLKLGISSNQWKIYNNFISILYAIIKENNNIVKTYEQKIEKKINKWFKNHITLKTWNYLNQKNQVKFKKYKILKENIMSDEFSQFKFFQEGNY